MSDALFDLPDPAPVEPYSCTGDAHSHRWLKFGRLGEKLGIVVDVAADGTVTISEQALDDLLKAGGFERHDPDLAEQANAKRKSWARSRLQDALNRGAR